MKYLLITFLIFIFSASAQAQTCEWEYAGHYVASSCASFVSSNTSTNKEYRCVASSAGDNYRNLEQCTGDPCETGSTWSNNADGSGQCEADNNCEANQWLNHETGECIDNCVWPETQQFDDTGTYTGCAQDELLCPPGETQVIDPDTGDQICTGDGSNCPEGYRPVPLLNSCEPEDNSSSSSSSSTSSASTATSATSSTSSSTSTSTTSSSGGSTSSSTTTSSSGNPTQPGEIDLSGIESRLDTANNHLSGIKSLAETRNNHLSNINSRIQSMGNGIADIKGALTSNVSGGGTCTARPTCSVDSVLCSILIQQWETRCKEDPVTVEDPLVFEEPTAEDEPFSETEQRVEAAKTSYETEIQNIQNEITQALNLSITGSGGIQSNAAEVLGVSVDFSLFRFLNELQLIGSIIIAAAYVYAAMTILDR